MCADLSLRQRSAWNGFAFEFADAGGTAVGSLTFANFAQAKNARLAFHPKGSSAGDCRIVLGDEALLFRFEYTRRGFINDLRYTLETPAGLVLCTADVTYEAGRRHPKLCMSHPLSLEVMPSQTFWAKRFPIVDASGLEIGAVQEPRALAFRFAYSLQLPAATRPVQAFVLAATYLARR